MTKDYGKHDAPLFTGIFAPKDAPAWVQDREQLWNKAEAAERQANGQPARNMIVAFPHELNQQQREWLIKDFAREEFARRGMVADVAMHAPDKQGDQRNYHAHILLTMRKLDGPEFSKTKCREWNSKEQLGQWREGWAERGAKALERAGYAVEAERWRHGHQTLGEQRAAALKRGDKEFAESLDREPTPHIGPTATGMDRRGVSSERMERVKEIIARNDIRVEQKSIGRELAALEREEMELRRGRGPAGDGPGWTDRAGMVAQEASAMKAVRAADAPERKRLGFFEDRDPQSPTPAWEPESGQGGNKWLRFFEDQQRPGSMGPREPSHGVGGVRVVNSVTGAVSKLGEFMLEFMGGASAPAPSPERSAKPDRKAFLTDPVARKEQQLAQLAAMRQAEAAEKALGRIGRDMAAGHEVKSADLASLTRGQREHIQDYGEEGLRQLVEDHRQRLAQSQGRERER